jgi:hypothetical protein
MTDDDDILHDYDLSAWEAPPPPATLADAVIARVADAPGAPAIETVERSRRWWLAGVAGASVVATAAIVMVVVVARHGAHHAAPSHGELAATNARHLDLDTASAELDPGATVTWNRDGHGITIVQRGTATWRVDADEQLRIETGATLAPVEASGASLRVEAHMNISDMRVIGASTVTAAAVAFVTVVVYEGHVRVGTVNIQPGTTVEVRPDKPPAPPIAVSATDPRTDQLEAEVVRLRQQVADLEKAKPAGNAPPAEPCAQDECLLTNNAAPCCVKYRTQPPASPGGLTREMISTAMAKVRTQIDACGTGVTSLVKVKVAFKVGPDGTVTSVSSTVDPAGEGPADLVPCVATAAAKAPFPRTTDGGSFSYPFVFTNHTPTKFDFSKCDFEDLKQKAMDAINNGQHASALVTLEAALQCKPDDGPALQLAFMSACNSQNAAQAKKYYLHLSPTLQNRLKSICVRNKIDIDQVAAPAATDCQPAGKVDPLDPRPVCGTTGFLEISSQPTGLQVEIDGVKTGKVTPIAGHALPIAPGKHRVTFIYGPDRFTYPVIVEVGKTATVDKDLR